MTLPEDLAVGVAAAQARTAMPLQVVWYPQLSSTMDAAAAAVADGAPEGYVAVADEQTAGRGRRGRRWSSPVGAGLYFSMVLKPRRHGAPAPWLPVLTLAAGLGAAVGIRAATGLSPLLKWPNDVYVGPRKVCGILAEAIGLGTAGEAVIVGVGINVGVAVHPADVSARATSLERELGRPVDRGLVLAETLVGLGAAYADLVAGKAGDILGRWRRAAPSAEGATVEWDGPTGVQTGVTAGVDDAGALLVRTPCGVERIVAGEVRWLS